MQSLKTPLRSFKYCLILMPAFVQALKKPLRFAFGLKKTSAQEEKMDWKLWRLKSAFIWTLCKRLAQPVITTSSEKDKQKELLIRWHRRGEQEEIYNQSDMRSSSGTPCRPEIRSSELDLKDSANPLVGMYTHDLTRTVWRNRSEETPKRFGLQQRVALLKRCLSGWR